MNFHAISQTRVGYHCSGLMLIIFISVVHLLKNVNVISRKFLLSETPFSVSSVFPYADYETILGFSLSLSKQAAESHMLEKSALLHCKMAFVRCKILASLLPCLLLSWPWVSQDQTMTQVLRPDC